ncbi:hypothetical protein K470DRAFT_217779 [Piedraia hortae CBS 480.64]|uniref:Uncharacterized protein n=1 Tax=Piedraia hortae CBS 480.64 TaxID=1314780 RepID=A0A6A7BY04_9PEZI|nr:hypothetical protein K470DRAFT_217779 [Piedraia hortae CBS 480.64]
MAPSHSSVQASLDDFEARELSPIFPDSEMSSRRSHSPPAWRKTGVPWFAPHDALQDNNDDNEEEEDEDNDITALQFARRLPLPRSPSKGRTPEPPAKEPDPSNYFRFSTRLDVVHKTQPVEDAMAALRRLAARGPRSRWHALGYVMVACLAWMLLVGVASVPGNGGVPDLVKVAGLAKSLEPAIYYSERGHAQIGELQETGVAVWDLGESVRSTNMSSAPIIVRQLDGLSDSIKTLAIELTRFFAGVDGDIDNVLLTMEWAQRELAGLDDSAPGTLGAVWTGTQNALALVGARSVIGLSRQQKTRETLERVFTEYLGVLEESINNELAHSMQLFQLFEAIDMQFLNLQRSVIREQDTQEKLENDFLSSLWTRVIGASASQLRKYAKNRDLLASVRERTVRNKHVLVDHNQRLRQLQSNLETLRRKLVSPQVRRGQSTTPTIEDQMRGLQSTYDQLKTSREVQRRRVLEQVYGRLE